MKKLIVIVLAVTFFQTSFAQKCKSWGNEYNIDLNMQVKNIYGDFIFNNSGKSMFSGSQDAVYLGACKNEEGALFIYLAHSRYLNGYRQDQESDFSIAKDMQLVLVTKNGPIKLTAYQNQGSSKEIKMSQLKLKVRQVYIITPEQLSQLSQDPIEQILIEYTSMPKFRTDVKSKNAESVRKQFSCALTEYVD